MKKSSKIALASFLFSCFAFSGANAQDKMLKAPTFGFKGGVNFSNLYTDNVDDNNVLTGFNAGLFAKLPVSNTVAIQPEIYYTTKGAEVTYNNAFANGTAKFNVNYVEVPVLLVVNLTDKFNIHAGPYAAYMVSGKTENDNNLFTSNDELDTNDFNKFDAGIAAGLGVDLEVLSFGVRYNYGLTKVGKERDYSGTSYTYPDAKNSVLNVYVGFALN
ncbi:MULTISPECIES: porin family protein [unclassified Flavobacterium]|uniref:porin family protein n=1 Tax=unclassified Flavobacterium TaxID=196869 RepID=UPI003F9381FD